VLGFNGSIMRGLEEPVRIETTGYAVEGHIIVGRIRRVFIGNADGMSRLTIDDEYDNQVKEVLVHTEIFAKLVSLEQARNGLEGARVILASRSYTINLGKQDKFQDVFELISVLDGELVGHLLVYQNRPNHKA